MFETLNKYISDTERAMLEATPAIVVPEVLTSVAKRNYDGAKVSRLNTNWRSNAGTANTVLNTDLRRLRDRSREMARNHPHITQFARLMTNNIVGKGATLQIKSKKKGQSATARANEVEQAFKEWGKKQYCTASTRLSWARVQRFVVNRVCIDGEVLIRKVIDKNNPFGFSLKIYNADWLDHDYREILPNGNRVIMGVEVDALDKPVAYYLKRPVGDVLQGRYGDERTRVSADFMIHAFIADESEDQVHAAPWLHAMMWRLKMLGEFEMAEAVKQNAVANTVGFIKPPADELTPRADDEDASALSLTQISDDGMFVEMPAGYELQTFDIKPDPTSQDFKAGLLRAAAAGGGLSYHTLSGDLSKVNYSSAKIGGLSERDHFEILQEWFIEDVCEPVLAWFMELGRITGKVTIDPAQFTPEFRARGWTWVEPAKEAAAFETLLQNKLTTVREIQAEKGKDLETYLDELEAEIKMFESKGLTHPSAQAQPTTEQPKKNAETASDKKPKPSEK